MTTRTSIALALAGLALLAGCAEEDAEVLLPETVPVSEIFDRYVALGNSITAGYQSSGINDSTQLRAYPVLLAAQADAEFVVPLFERPGCNPPLAAPFSSERVGIVPGPSQCAARIPATGPIQNLAVPGATIAATSDITASANALTTFILGGRTPIARMLELDPTLVTAWVGNNDVLGAVLTGNTAALTPVASFETDLDELVTAILQTPAGEDGAVVLIGVVDPRVIPAAQPGLFAYVAWQNPATRALLEGLGIDDVDDTCAPLTAGGQPNPLAFNFVSLGIINEASEEEEGDVISCGSGDAFVSTPADLAAITARAAAFNGLIEERAGEHGWIFVDPNDLLLPYLGDPNLLRKCQGYQTATTQEQIAVATATTCPSPVPTVGFGNLISFDGFHPSSLAHRLVANAIIGALNAKFGLAIEPLDAGI